MTKETERAVVQRLATLKCDAAAAAASPCLETQTPGPSQTQRIQTWP